MKKVGLLVCGLLCLFGLEVNSPAAQSQSAPFTAHDFESSLPVDKDKEDKANQSSSGLWISKPVTPGRQFNLVGLRWKGKPTDLKLRSRAVKGGWSRWVAVESADAPRRQGRQATDPIWTGGATAVQLRANRPLRQAKLHFVAVNEKRHSKAKLNAKAQRPQARSAANMPAIIPRQSWAGSSCNPRGAPAYGQVQMGVIHHTVSTMNYTPEQSGAIVLSICRFHMNSNHWNDIGYNFLIDQYGQIFEGRAGGIDLPVIGAQAQGFNGISTGISMIGNYQDVPPSPATVDSAARLIAWKLPLYNTPILGTYTVFGPVGRFGTGQQATLQRVSGHRDVNSTDCPGNALYNQIPVIATLAASYAGNPAAAASTDKNSQLVLNTPAKHMLYRRKATISGQLTTGTGKPVTKATIAIERRRGSRWVVLGKAKTDRKGKWKLTLRAQSNMSIRATYKGTANQDPANSKQAKLFVAPRISARLNRSRAQRTQLVVTSGSVQPQLKRVTASVYQRNKDGSYQLLQRKTLPVKGNRFSGKLQLKKAGLYRIEAQTAGSSKLAAAAAKPLFIRVLN